MPRTRDPRKMAQIAALYGAGANITRIAQEVGLTRQTISGYLRSEEMQSAVEGVQSAMVGALDTAVSIINEALKDAIPKERVAIALKVMDKIGTKVIDQVPKGSEDRKKWRSPEERSALLEQLKGLITIDTSGASDPQKVLDVPSNGGAILENNEGNETILENVAEKDELITL